MSILGLVFFLGTAVGMVRFDFYTRMHAQEGGHPIDYADAHRVWLGDHGGLFHHQLVITR